MLFGKKLHTTPPTGGSLRTAPHVGPATLESLEDRRLFSIVNAVADSFVREGSFAATNFGAAPLLYSKNAAGDTREAYIKFDVSSAGTVGTAVLRFDAKLQTNSTPSTRVGIFGLTDAAWPEGNGTTSNAEGDGTDTDNSPAGELTFNNRPAATSAQPIDIITISGGVQQSYALDVSTFVRNEATAGHNVVGFVLRSLDAATDFVAYVSREDVDFGPVLDVGAQSGPTAALSAPNIITPAGSTSTVVVTYTDPEDVDVLSLSNDDITILDPNGQALVVSGFSSDPSSTASTLAVTYTVQAPGGGWDDADTGTYVVRLNAGQVSDTFENFAPPGALGSFAVGANPPPTDDGIGPTAALGTVPAVVGGDTMLQFNVTFSDDSAVDVSDIAPGNVTITQNGSGSPLTVISATPDANADGPTRVVTYVVQAPGGTWDFADNGTYTIALAGNQVSDTADHFATAATLGTFEVNLSSTGGDGRTLKGSFGSTGGRPVALTFGDTDGTFVSVSLKGGSGQVFERNGVYDLDLSGTSAASALGIKTRGGDGRVRLGNVTGAGLKSLSAKTADLAGAITLSGPLTTLQLGNINGGFLNCGGGSTLALQLGTVNNFSINSGSAIKSIKAVSWSDDGAADAINAPAVGSVTISGGFAADITTSAIKSLKAGVLSGATLRATDSIGKVTLGSMSDSTIFAGINGSVTGLPDAGDDIVNSAASIKGVSVKSTFSNSMIAAPSIAKASLGAIQASNGGTPFGVFGDSIKGIAGTANGSRLKLAKLDASSQSQVIGDFAVRVI